MGGGTADLAYLAISKLSGIYSVDAHGEALCLPRHYLEAYLECINKRNVGELVALNTSAPSSSHLRLAAHFQELLTRSQAKTSRQ